MTWKAEDEVTTTFGSIQLAKKQAYEDGADAMFGRLKDALAAMDLPTYPVEDADLRVDPLANTLTLKMSDFTNALANSCREGISSEKASIADRIQKMCLAAEANGSAELLPGLRMALDAIIKGGFSDIEIGGDE